MLINVCHTLYDLLIETRDMWFAAGCPAVPFPDRIVQEDDLEYVNASALGGCPKLEAAKRKELPPQFAVTKPGWLSYTGRVGTEVARMWQSAIKWRFGDNALIEEYIKNPDLGVKGYADAILFISGEIRAYVEIKFREPGSRRYLRASDFWQVMAYAHGADDPIIGVLVIDWGKPATNGGSLYTLQPDGNGYSAVDIDGRVYPAAWNHPDMLSYHRLAQVIGTHQAYLEGDTLAALPPISDPFNDERGYLCLSWETYPRSGVEGVAVNACPVGCHFVSSDDRITVHRVNGRNVAEDVLRF